MAPAFQGTKVDVTPALKGGGDVGETRPHLSCARASSCCQIGLSFLLLVAAALFLRSLHNLLDIDTGFARDSILVASIDASPDRSMQFYPRLLEEVRRLPGVLSAGLADAPPLGTNTGWNIFVAGYIPRADEPRASPSVGFLSPGYFATMQIPLLLGATSTSTTSVRRTT